ncbi:MAG: tRNA adenosine(34) deaminase TadA [Candidatus Brocadiales bacterium]|nr:tRNA adenosine(34) deaminase TadA [Candidatus Brocadiales bacterium]
MLRSRVEKTLHNHEYYMEQALKEAKEALEKDEVPVGAVIVHNGSIIARAHNQREMLKDPTAHAEMIAITQAADYLQNWRLTGATIYVTKEPCAMCAGALVQARVDTLVYGAPDAKGGACQSVVNLVQEPRFNHRLKVISGVLNNECVKILQEFFSDRCRK